MIYLIIAYTLAVVIGVTCLIISDRGKIRSQRDLESPINELLEQIRWLPITSILRGRYHEGYPAEFPEFLGSKVPVMELEGDITLVGENDVANSVFLNYNGTRITLPPHKREWLGNVFRARLAECALESTTRKLLEK